MPASGRLPQAWLCLQGYLTILTSDSDLFIKKKFFFWKPIWKRSFIKDTVLEGSKGIHVLVTSQPGRKALQVTHGFCHPKFSCVNFGDHFFQS